MPLTAESGNAGNLMDAVPTACCSQKQRRMPRSTVANGETDESMCVRYLTSQACVRRCLCDFVLFQGTGTYVYSQAAVYEGAWIEDRRAGWGKMNYENGDVYEGEWMKDECHGHGTIRYGEKTFLDYDLTLEWIVI